MNTDADGILRLSTDNGLDVVVHTIQYEGRGYWVATWTATDTVGTYETGQTRYGIFENGGIDYRSGLELPKNDTALSEDLSDALWLAALRLDRRGRERNYPRGRNVQPTAEFPQKGAADA